MKTITQHFINGEFVDSHGQEIVDIFNPATNELIGRATLGDEEDADRAIAAAKEAFKTYSQSSLPERAGYLQRLAEALTERLEDLKAATVQEYGGLKLFVDYAITQARDFFVLAQEVLKPENFQDRIGHAAIAKVPIGVAGLLTPWNGNPWFICAKLASALAAGCTAVIKPSNLSILEAQILMECFAKAGLPPGVINVVNGRGEVVGNAITRSPDVQKISFTGSSKVGKQLGRDAMETMKRVTLELGGKSATIILDDADLPKAVAFALQAGLINSGQACIAGTRILVPATRLAEAKHLLREGIGALKIGDPANPETQIQPLVSKGHYERVQGYIRTGLAEGAEVLIGGEGHPQGLEGGNFMKPTVFVNVTNDMRIAQEEIFGPVLCVIPYRTDDEAVAIANDSPYGLHGYVYGGDRDRAVGVAWRIRAGRVMVNQLFDEPTAPFGGFKQSGFGREFGVYGLQAFLESQAVFSA